MRNWTSRQSEVMYETDRVVILFFTSKDEGKKICASYRIYISGIAKVDEKK